MIISYQLADKCKLAVNFHCHSNKEKHHLHFKNGSLMLLVHQLFKAGIKFYNPNYINKYKIIKTLQISIK